MKKLTTRAAVLAGLATLASAQVVASDDFSYTGALTSNGWFAHSGAGNKVVMADGSVATLAAPPWDGPGSGRATLTSISRGIS